MSEISTNIIGDESYTLHVHSVGKVYGHTRALADINIHFKMNEITCIVGKNGSGKSTLLSLLTCKEHPTEGEIRNLQRPRGFRSTVPLPVSSEDIGYCAQDNNLPAYLTLG